MNMLSKFSTVLLSVFTLASCSKEHSGVTGNSSQAAEEASHVRKQNPGTAIRGFVYTMTNQQSGNRVLVYNRQDDGTISYSASFDAGGNGTGSGLGNQGALALSEGKDVLLVVNPGSNTISSFTITGNGLVLQSTTGSGGVTPVSITQHGHLVYVLNAGGDGNIAGFWLGSNDRLYPIPGSARPLSTTASGPAQISFVDQGKVLVVTEKATNKIISYTIGQDGRPGLMHSISSASATPFGFAPGYYGNFYVTEAVGGAAGASNLSSYHVSDDGTLSLTQGPVATGQTAACWAVMTADGENVYTTNTGSNNLSSFKVNSLSGAISLNQGSAAPAAVTPIDAAISSDSKFMYVLNSTSHAITGYSIAENGAITLLQTIDGLPAGTNGLAAK